MRTRRSIPKLALLAITALAASGCVTFNGATTASQVAASGDVGTTLRYGISICSNGAGGPGGGPSGGPCAPTSNFFAIPSSGRIILGILVPTGATAPAVATANLSAPATVTRAGTPTTVSDIQAFRTSQLSADMNLATPAPAGSTWVGYITENITVGPGVSFSATGTIDVALPADAVGNPTGTASRQVTTHVPAGPVTGTDPAAGQTDTLTYDCFVDADNDGVADVPPTCFGALDPAAPAAVPLRRLTFTGPSASNVEVGASKVENLALRLDGPALPTADVTITTSITGAGLTASAPATATTISGSNVVVPVTVAASLTADPGTLTVRARTSNGTERTVVVPVNAIADATRPSTSITARRLLASGKLRLQGQATDADVSAGLVHVKVQAVHGIGKGRCMAWNGTKVVRELCSVSLARWITITQPVTSKATTIDWTATTPVAVPGLWLLRARAADAEGLVSRVGTARVTVPKPLPKPAARAASASR